MIEDTYRVLPHRDINRCHDWRTAYVLTYTHRPCSMKLSYREIVEENWCGHCAATINKAASRRAAIHRSSL